MSLRDSYAADVLRAHATNDTKTFITIVLQILGSITLIVMYVVLMISTGWALPFPKDQTQWMGLVDILLFKVEGWLPYTIAGLAYGGAALFVLGTISAIIGAARMRRGKNPKHYITVIWALAFGYLSVNALYLYHLDPAAFGLGHIIPVLVACGFHYLAAMIEITVMPISYE